jgi:aarF domain-containing kinase
VQRPGLRRQFDVDLATMRFLTSATVVAFPDFDFSFLVPEFAQRLARELDFIWEGRSCERTVGRCKLKPVSITPSYSTKI